MASEPKPTTIVIVSLDAWPPTERGSACKDENGLWWVCCPGCGLVSVASRHTITEHADGTVSFSPSLLCPKPGCGTHYFIERNRIRYV